MKQSRIAPFLVFFLAACATISPITPAATRQVESVVTGTLLTLTPILAEALTPTPSPIPFPENIDPLTGLEVSDPSILDRRPLIVKVANLPRFYRPQWGLSKADQVFEYYTEEGTTRFAAVFLGQDASMVGPIRSGRLFDNHLISMYKANFAFGSADYRVRDLLYSQSYADRLVIESSCPPMCRLETDGLNYLMTNTADLTTHINNLKVTGGNKRQNLDGFSFNDQTPVDGEPGRRIYVRYSSAIYNRWDYKPGRGKYYRHSDVENDLENGKNEVYSQLTDRLTGDPISADNVVILVMLHKYFSLSPEIVNIVFWESGKAYLFRNGMMFELQWQRNVLNQIFTLVGEDGKTFPLKLGNTWFEVVGTSSQVENTGDEWRFTFSIP
jgi:hypothetical protein